MKTARITLTVLTGLLSAFLLTGCLARPAGGPLTKQGMEALEHNEYQTALTDFQQALLNGEDAVMACRGQGIALMGVARYEDAAASFGEAIGFADAKMPETVLDLRLYQASAFLRAGNYPEVITAASAVLEKKQLPEACYLMGAAYLGLGDQDQAKEYFDQAIALTPKDYSLYLQIYQAYEAYSLTAVGDVYLQDALKIHPESEEDHWRIGQIYYYLQQYQEARSALMESVEKGYLPALELLGEIYLAQEDYPHALAAYEQIMQEKGESPQVYNGLALCAMSSGDYDQALEYIRQGLAMEPEEGKQQLRFNEMVAYEKKLEFGTALEKAQEYTALYPTDNAGQKELQFLRTRGQ